MDGSSSATMFGVAHAGSGVSGSPGPRAANVFAMSVKKLAPAWLADAAARSGHR
jgi:hypothetical protein